MTKEKKLQDIVELNSESEHDEKLSKVLDLSVKIKNRSRIVDGDKFKVTSYYLCIADKGIAEEIKSLDIEEKDILYEGLKRPLMLMQNNDEVSIFYQNPDYVESVYDMKSRSLSGKQLRNLKEMYEKGIKPDTKDDKKYSIMYKVSSKLKNKGIKVTIKDDGLEFYITELSSLEENGDKTMDYLSHLNNNDATKLAYITGPFYIIDTKNKMGYSIVNSKDKNDNETSSFKKIEDKWEYDAFYKILEGAKKTPEKRNFIIDGEKEDEENEYKPSGEAPKDFYR